MAQPQWPANARRHFNCSTYYFHCATQCLSLSASAAVKVSATQNAKNVARKVIKMFKTRAQKTALLKFCIKDISNQGETKR